MKDRNTADMHTGGNTRGFVSGLLFGGLAGVAMGLMMAPRSGEETRALLRDKGLELKSTVEESAHEAREKAGTFATEAREKAGTLATEVREKAGTLATEVREKAESAIDNTRAKVQGKTSQIGRTVGAATHAAQDAWVEEE